VSFNKARNKTDEPVWSPETLRDPHGQDDKARKVQRMFDAIARRYDLANTIISFGQAGLWRKRLIRMVRESSPSPGRILDLCCGTGAMTTLLLKAFPQARTVGADFSRNMVKIARKKRQDCPARYVCGDGLTLPFESDTFDMVTCVFGLRNYQSLETGLKEIQRTLRNGGMLAVLEFQPPSVRGFRSIFHFYFKRILPLLGDLVSGGGKIGAYEYLPQSVDRWYDIQTVLKMMRDCGLKELRVRKMCFGSVWAIVAEK
jgi:demethylmenaquinone methyltransferase/2-methoxy-6-polyprenyl-1,4-benzoquinol methylase